MTTIRNKTARENDMADENLNESAAQINEYH